MLPSRFHGIASAALLCALPLFAGENAPSPSTGTELPPTRAISSQDEAKTFQLPPRYHVELVLSEPEIMEPVITAFDGNGRMYVAEMRSYMQEIDGKNEMDPVSRVSLHWSSKNDGHYDKHTVFADKLVLPRMILPLDDRRVVIGETNTSDLYLYTDTKRVGVADKKELGFRAARAPAISSTSRTGCCGPSITAAIPPTMPTGCAGPRRVLSANRPVIITDNGASDRTITAIFTSSTLAVRRGLRAFRFPSSMADSIRARSLKLDSRKCFPCPCMATCRAARTVFVRRMARSITSPPARESRSIAATACRRSCATTSFLASPLDGSSGARRSRRRMA